MLDQVVSLEALSGPPILSVICGLGSVLILLMVIGLCACKEKPSKKGDVESNELETVENGKKKKSGKGHKKQASNVSVIETESADNRHSNVSVANGKAKSHDRALPAIPAVEGSSEGIMATDDEMEEDPGHYDIIPKKTAAAPSGKGGKKSKKDRPNPYEKVVGDPDSDPTYAGIKEDNESAKLSFAGAGLKLHNPDPTYSAVNDDVNDPVYSGIKEDDQSDFSDTYNRVKGSHPYAVVAGVGDAHYAHIDEVAKQNRRSQLQQSHAAANTDAMDNGSHASVPPPVPDKNYDASSDTGELASPPLALSSSPSLPPRNSMAAANGNGLDLSHSSDGGMSLPPPQSIVMASNGATVVGVNGASVVPLGVVDDGAAAGPSAAEIEAAIKEAKYSKVTARESLDSLKKRQTELQSHLPNTHHGLETIEDATYDSVTYDEIRSPGASGGVSSPPVAGDRGSMTSDLYAEISSGQNSTRSSTYARVGDMQVFEFPSQARPDPPPLDTLKKKLASAKNAEEEDVPDPGYSVIKRPRPQSVHSTSSNQNQSPQAGRRSPVYAVVDKSQKTRNRQTVHMTENINREISHAPTNPVENLYSEIDKSKKARPHGNNPGAAHGGARPKVRNNQLHKQSLVNSAKAAKSSIQGEVLDPGYQTIGSVGKAGQPEDGGSGSEYDPNYDSIPSDPNYDRIRERDVADGGSDYDPNYESVTTLTASITGSSAAARSPTEPGVAREITTSGSPASHPFPRREHIYQDIDEAKGGSSHSKSHNARVAPHSTAL